MLLYLTIKKIEEVFKLVWCRIETVVAVLISYCCCCCCWRFLGKVTSNCMINFFFSHSFSFSFGVWVWVWVWVWGGFQFCLLSGFPLIQIVCVYLCVSKCKMRDREKERSCCSSGEQIMQFTTMVTATASSLFFVLLRWLIVDGPNI